MNKTKRDYRKMMRTIEREEYEADTAYHADYCIYDIHKNFVDENDYSRWCAAFDADLASGLRRYHYSDSLV